MEEHNSAHRTLLRVGSMASVRFDLRDQRIRSRSWIKIVARDKLNVDIAACRTANAHFCAASFGIKDGFDHPLVTIAHLHEYLTHLARELFTFFESDETVLAIDRIDQQITVIDRRKENFCLRQIDATLFVDG
jgi:hypothetical protein